MKNRFDTPIKFRNIPVISLVLIALFITGFGISCQSQAPASAPSAPSPGISKETTTGAPTPPNIEVAIAGFAFKPATLNILVGTTVVWHNNDVASHTVTARDKSFDSGGLSKDGTFSFTFKQKGTFEYYCQIHPQMKGEIVVE